MYNQDDYDFDEDRYDDEEHENDEPDETDEDTEDASETDTGRPEEHMEIKEQVYQDSLATLKKKLQQLKDGTHHDYNRKVRKLEAIYNEGIRLNAIYKEYMIECVEAEYCKEKKAAAKEFEEKKVALKENLIADFEDKKKTIEAERHTMELSGDSMEVKPALTRKLRRRPNDPIPVPEKRRKPPISQISYILDDKEVENDLKRISVPFRKTSEGSNTGLHGISAMNDIALVETKVEDGKLLYERRWFHRGQGVYVEGRDMPKFPGTISAIANEAIYVKKNDNTKQKILIQSLAKGKVSIKRRAQ